MRRFRGAFGRFLDLLTKVLSEILEEHQTDAENKKPKMYVITALVTYPQTTFLVFPGLGTFGNPAIPTQFLFRLNTRSGDSRDDAALTQTLSVSPGSIGLVGVELHGSKPRATSWTFHGRNGVQQRKELVSVMNVGGR